jgi:hypothetical protein
MLHPKGARDEGGSIQVTRPSRDPCVMKRFLACLNYEAASFWGTETAIHDSSQRFWAKGGETNVKETSDYES